ncbi:MAG: major capsid protein [Microviridae sp.]|nr:MAG: major capsid protein [Microviridae sp.]
MQVQLGGESRIGSGNKMKVDMHEYGKSNNDLSHQWKSTMAAGTLVPFLTEVALPGDNYDIDLDAVVLTHPTIGPLFDGYKLQLDIYSAPMRLYQSVLNNDKLGVGFRMADVKLPVMTLQTPSFTSTQYEEMEDIDNCQINPSCILSYLGLRGIGVSRGGDRLRSFNALPLLAYWDIYKNYYANKAEGIGAVIHNDYGAPPQNVIAISIDGTSINQGSIGLTQTCQQGDVISITTTGQMNAADIYLKADTGIEYRVDELFVITLSQSNLIEGNYDEAGWGQLTIVSWRYRDNATGVAEPKVVTFDLNDIDTIREQILQWNNATPFEVLGQGNYPYDYLQQITDDFSSIQQTQEGLGIKTYQSDLFNNWMRTDWIDGVNGVNAVSAVDVSSGELRIDALIMQRAVYNLLNRVAVSGGSYQDWISTVYTEGRQIRTITPVYHGGLIKEIVFQEVISQAVTEGNPLGTLGGRGVMGKKHKGGKVNIRVMEPSYIMGIVSITPRINYSQGNNWDMHLKTMDDLHKPAMDGIGFQDLITEQMAWWDTHQTAGNAWVQKSAGKQPSWMNLRTRVDKCYGNFGIETNEMFMTLNRKYEASRSTGSVVTIADLTTYIDPVKYNSVFAQTNLDAQNFWVVINMGIFARKVLSSRLIPNL